MLDVVRTHETQKAYDHIIFLAGNAHLANESYELRGRGTVSPIPAMLKPTEVLTVVISALSGESWGCSHRDKCGVEAEMPYYALQGLHLQANTYHRLSGLPAQDYDAAIVLKRASASLPLVQSMEK